MKNKKKPWNVIDFIKQEIIEQEGGVPQSKIPSPVKPMLYKKGGGSGERSGTFMVNTNYQEIEN